MRTELIALRDAYFHWLLGCTIAVFIGVILEEFETFPGSPGARLDVTKGVLVPRYRLLDWKKRIAKYGWLLIVFGVLGEGVFEYAAAATDGLVQSFDEMLLSIAIERAATADRDASIAKDRASGADQKSEGFRLQIAKANERASNNEKEAALLRKQNLAMEKTLAEYLAKNAPRRVSGEQAKLLGQRCLLLRVKKVKIFDNIGNSEEQDFADDLERALRCNGVVEVLRDHGAIWFPAGTPTEQKHGLELSLGDERVDDAKVLSKALQDAGLVSPSRRLWVSRDKDDKQALELRILAK